MNALEACQQDLTIIIIRSFEKIQISTNRKISSCKNYVIDIFVLQALHQLRAAESLLLIRAIQLPGYFKSVCSWAVCICPNTVGTCRLHYCSLEQTWKIFIVLLETLMISNYLLIFEVIKNDEWLNLIVITKIRNICCSKYITPFDSSTSNW